MRWLGDSAENIATFSSDAKLKLGDALRSAQEGAMHPSAKPMRGALREVTEIVANCGDGTFRLMYTTQIGEVIYVLHTFKKKAASGISTSRHDIELIEKRLKGAKEHARGAEGYRK